SIERMIHESHESSRIKMRIGFHSWRFVRFVDRFFCFSLFLMFVSHALGWPSVFPSGTTIFDKEKTENGYVLFTPLESAEGGGRGVIYLINLKGEVVHQWSVPFSPLHARLLPDGHVVVIGRNDKQEDGRIGLGKYEIGGVAGWLVELDWDGKLISKHVD